MDSFIVGRRLFITGDIVAGFIIVDYEQEIGAI